MGQRSLSYLTVFGLAIAAMALFRYTPSRHPSPADPPLAPVWHEPERPAIARLKQAYQALSPEAHMRLYEGAPYTRFPAAFRTAVHEAVVELHRWHAEQLRKDYMAGGVTERDYREKRAYDEYVPKHLADYQLSANGDGFHMILFRTLLPGRDRPPQDVGRGIHAICPVK